MTEPTWYIRQEADRENAEAVEAACGRTDPHGAHATPVYRAGWCAGNINVVTASLDREEAYFRRHQDQPESAD